MDLDPGQLSIHIPKENTPFLAKMHLQENPSQSIMVPLLCLLLDDLFDLCSLASLSLRIVCTEAKPKITTDFGDVLCAISESPS